MLAWQLCDFQGIRTCIAKKPYIFVIFQRGQDPLPPPSGSAYAFTQDVHIFHNDCPWGVDYMGYIRIRLYQGVHILYIDCLWSVEFNRYSKICVLRPLKNRQNKDLNDKWYA